MNKVSINTTCAVTLPIMMNPVTGKPYSTQPRFIQKPGRLVDIRTGWCHYGESMFVNLNVYFYGDFLMAIQRDHPGSCIDVVHQGYIGDDFANDNVTIEIRVIRAPICLN